MADSGRFSIRVAVARGHRRGGNARLCTPGVRCRAGTRRIRPRPAIRRPSCFRPTPPCSTSPRAPRSSASGSTTSTSNWVTLSAGAARLSGLPPDAARVRPEQLHERVHPDDVRHAPDGEYEEAVAGSDTYQMEFRVRMAGRAVRMAAHLRARCSAQGDRIVRVVGAFLDIHQERRLLDQLRENADRMALAEDVAGFGVWQLDLRTTRCRCHLARRSCPDSTARTDRHRAAGAVGADPSRGSRRSRVEATRRAIDEQKIYKADFRMLQTDGGLRWVRSEGRVDRENGEAVRMTGAIIDLTREREFADRAARGRRAHVAGRGDRRFRRLGSRSPAADRDDLGRVAPSQRPARDRLAHVYTLDAFNAAARDREHIDAVMAAGDEAFRTGQPFDIEMRLRPRRRAGALAAHPGASPLQGRAAVAAGRRDARHHQRDRDAAVARGGARERRGGRAGQERLPRQHEPRDPHADERRDRHDRAAARDRAHAPSSATTPRRCAPRATRC